MWIAVLVVVAAVATWLYFKTKKKPSVRLVNREETVQEDGSKTITLQVQIDAKEILRKREEFQKNRIKWSGRSHGPFPIKKFTDGQWSCICDAVGRKRIMIGDTYAPRGDAPADVAFHFARTVNSMLKHGFIETDGAGAFVCTDFGAFAYEKLPT